MKKFIAVCFTLSLVGLLTVSCAMPVKTGTDRSKTVATGSAAGAAGKGQSELLPHCDATLGTLALHENRNQEWYEALARSDAGFKTLAPVLRLLAQQSGCFVVVERGSALDDVVLERELMQSGELREHSSFGKGQLVAADYTLNPHMLLNDSNATTVGGVVGGLLGFGGLGALAGGMLSFSDAQCMMTLIDNRSGVQVAVSEGSATGTSWGAGGGLGSSFGGMLGAYTRTSNGKILVGAMLDAYKNLVVALKDYKAQKAAGPKGHGTGGKLKVE